MGRQQEASDEGGLFSLELSSHGGTAFSRGKEAARGDDVGSAGISGRKLASYVVPNTMFEFKVRFSDMFEARDLYPRLWYEPRGIYSSRSIGANQLAQDENATK